MTTAAIIGASLTLWQSGKEAEKKPEAWRNKRGPSRLNSRTKLDELETKLEARI
jgi:hypothetical protein